MNAEHLFVILALASSPSFATDERGILPGEPSPAGPFPRKEPHGLLIDDRYRCPEGQIRMLKMKCAGPGEEKLECDNYAPVIECIDAKSEKAQKTTSKRIEEESLNCKPPQKPVQVYRCVGDEQAPNSHESATSTTQH